MAIFNKSNTSRITTFSIKDDRGLFDRKVFNFSQMVSVGTSENFYDKFKTKVSKQEAKCKDVKIKTDSSSKVFKIINNKNVYKTTALHKLSDGTFAFNIFEKENSNSRGLYEPADRNNHKTMLYKEINKQTEFKGPFKAVYQTNEYDNLLFAVNEQNKFLAIDKDFKETDLNYKFIDKNHFQDLENGKYGIIDSFNNIVTKALFETPNAETDIYHPNIIYDNGKVHIVKNDKIICTVENYVEATSMSTHIEENLAIINADDKLHIINTENGKTIFTSDKKVQYYHERNGEYTFTYEDGTKEVIKLLPNDKYENKDYETTEIKNGVILAKDLNNKCGLVDEKTGEILMPFEYDSFEANNDSNSYSRENRSKLFVSLRKDDKFGIYNTVDRKMALPIEYNGFKHIDESDEYVSDYKKGKQYEQDPKQNQLYRFIFEGEDGKVGIVNSKNHIVVDPVMKIDLDVHTSMFHDDNVDGYTWDYRDVYFEPDDKISTDHVYFSLQSPHIIPQTSKTVYRHEERTVTTDKCINKYSDDEKALGTVLGLAIMGPVAGMLVNSFMDSAKVVSTQSKQVKVESSHQEEIDNSKFSNYIHMDYKDMDKDINPLNQVKAQENDEEMEM